MWKTIKGYEGLYEISDKGEVRSFDRVLPCGHNSSHIRKGKILTPCGNGKGYLQIYLIKDGKAKKFYIHRLVAEAFIDNPNNYPIINHKDENRSNNEASNLEWCNHLYNSNYGHCRQKISDSHNKKPVIQVLPDGTEVRYESSHYAERCTQINHSSIVKCCKGRAKTAGGFAWRYAV